MDSECATQWLFLIRLISETNVVLYKEIKMLRFNNLSKLVIFSDCWMGVTAACLKIKGNTKI